MGLVHSVWQLTTVVVVGPAIVVGALAILDGRSQTGLLFIGLALAFALVSEYAYVRLTGRTVGRLRRLVTHRNRREE